MTSIHRHYYDPEVDSAPLPKTFDFVERKDATAKARRAFWRGAIIFAALGFVAGLTAGQAFGDTISISGTTVSMVPSLQPGAEADVVVENFMLNGPMDDGEYPLAMGRLVVTVQFHWDYGALGGDRVIVIPPVVYVCRPETCDAIVPEAARGVVVIYPWVGM